MVSLSDVHASNSRISSSLPAGLVAVFVGGTNGIGEPRVYFIGRSQDAGDRILAECKTLNTDGEFTFIKADVSLLSVVDEISRDIKSKEKAINLLFLTAGSPAFGEKTSEGLAFPAVLVHYSRARFIVNLLPLVQRATSLRRVVTVAAGSKESPINPNDYAAANVTPFTIFKLRGHIASVVTLSLETLAKRAPEVTFIHEYPGTVKTGIGRELRGFLSVMKIVLSIIGPWVYIPHEESAERHLFLATSAKYPPRAGTVPDDGSGVPGTTGEAGMDSGVEVKKVLMQLREEGYVEKVWEHTEEEFKRITASVSI
ncbi:hypothetical protein CPB84DRAFT_1813000 [Gymnopilus junonius]|uniref:Uncharacterized protein n=1 Tax=Gymnopilus junonius TaxID=109634 RepID=A0A9P5NYL6_GYMJU|nr:hypothetical protein CPB84DRAFT_1813000 [Gymnopilus junonius]